MSSLNQEWAMSVASIHRNGDSTNCMERIQAKLSWAWNAVVSTPKGQALVITLLFLSVWGTFGFALAMQGACAYAIGKLVYVVWNDRGMTPLVGEQNHQIDVLRESVMTSAADVAEQHAINQRQQKRLDALRLENTKIVHQNLQLIQDCAQLQQRFEARDFDLRQAKIQLEAALADKEINRTFRRTVNEQATALSKELEVLRSQILAAEKTRDEALFAKERAEEEMRALCLQTNLKKEKQSLKTIYAKINTSLHQIASCINSGQFKTAPSPLQKTIQELLPNLSLLKRKTLAHIDCQIEALPDSTPIKISLIAFQSHLLQETALLESISFLFAAHPPIEIREK